MKAKRLKPERMDGKLIRFREFDSETLCRACQRYEFGKCGTKKLLPVDTSTPMLRNFLTRKSTEAKEEPPSSTEAVTPVTAVTKNSDIWLIFTWRKCH